MEILHWSYSMHSEQNELRACATEATAGGVIEQNVWLPWENGGHSRDSMLVALLAKNLQF